MIAAAIAVALVHLSVGEDPSPALMAAALTRSEQAQAQGTAHPPPSGCEAQPPHPVPLLPAQERGKRTHIWIGLSLGQHAAATFDAWSTRRGISQGSFEEKNRFLFPFSESPFLYAAIQVVPLGLDYAGWLMINSDSSWLHRYWWLPQTASTVLHLAASTYNQFVQG